MNTNLTCGATLSKKTFCLLFFLNFLHRTSVSLQGFEMSMFARDLKAWEFCIKVHIQSPFPARIHGF